MTTSRQLALLNGETYYLGTKPCKHGHPAPLKRFARGGGCYSCHIADNLRAYASNKLIAGNGAIDFPLES